jgi:alpha-tubulin suppressor-like RCC1 family protein
LAPNPEATPPTAGTGWSRAGTDVGSWAESAAAGVPYPYTARAPLRATVAKEDEVPTFAGRAGRRAGAILALSAIGCLGLSASAAQAARAQGTAPTALAAWGDNSAGELGDSTLGASFVPAAVNTSAAGSATITQVSAGARHDLALLSTGQVVAWGDSTFGELGTGSFSANGDAETPLLVPGLSGVAQVAAGGEDSLALLSNGTVDAWGDNEDGQLGDGTTVDSAVPVPVEGLSGVVSVSAGDQFNLALLSNGTVESWGYNGDGQLGDNSLMNSEVPVPVPGLTGVKAISAGGQYALALLENGTAMSWGDNEVDQLGDGQDVSTQAISTVPQEVSGLTGAVAVAAGFEHALALMGNGTVMAWGDNGFFQLARPQGFPGGISDSDVPLAVPGLNGATSIAAGGLFSLAVLQDGSVDAWGDNGLGQLGNGTNATVEAVSQVKGLTGVGQVEAGGADGVALAASTTAPAPASTPGGAGFPTSGPPSTPWRELPLATPLAPPSADMSSVSASSAGDAWAVGSRSLPTDKPFADHWDGNAWTAFTLPAGTNGTSSLSGVDDLSSTNAWAVGESGGTGDERTLIEHWDGSAWSLAPSPNPETGPGDFDELAGVAGTDPDDLWAVGTVSNGEESAFLLLHWDGTTWSVSPPPAVGLLFGEAITVVSANDVWAVGDTGGGTISAHFDGTKWTDVSTPRFQPNNTEDNFLTGITNAGPDNVWASGWGDDDGANFRTPYVLHWDGSAWSLVLLPDPGSEGTLLEGVAAVSPGDVWAVGGTFATDGASLAVTEHFDGTSWSTVAGLDPGQLAALSSNSLSAIASTGTTTAPTLFAVGAQETPGSIGLVPLTEGATAG